MLTIHAYFPIHAYFSATETVRYLTQDSSFKSGKVGSCAELESHVDATTGEVRWRVVSSGMEEDYLSMAHDDVGNDDGSRDSVW